MQKVPQVTTIPVTGTWGTADTATLTINGKDLTVTIGTDVDIADVVAAIVAAVNGTAIVSDESRNDTGDNIPEFQDITASGTASPITLTGDSIGTPFTVTVSEDTASTGALGTPTTTSGTPTGPNYLAAENVTGGVLPAAADTFTLENSSVSMLYGLDQSGAGTLTALNIKAGFTGSVGLPRYNTAGYVTYHDRYYQVRASVVDIGQGDGSGSGRIQLDIGSVQSAITIHYTATSSETDVYAVRLIGTHASNTLQAYGGSVDIAPEQGQVATIATLNAAGSAKVRTGPGVTLTTVNVGGNAAVDITSAAGLADITIIIMEGTGVLYIRGDNAITTLVVLSGTCDFRSAGTVTNVRVGSAGVLDLTNSTQDVTFTNTSLTKGGLITDPQRRITFTNAIDFGDAGLQDFPGLDLGRGLNILPS